MVHREITCREIVALLQNKERKSRIVIGTNILNGGKHEFRPLRTLEGTEDKFLEKYPGNHVGIELPEILTRKHELKIK